MSPALDWTDRAACRAWLADVALLVSNLVGVAEDQTSPLGERDLGRREACRLLSETTGALAQSMVYARQGLVEPTTH